MKNEIKVITKADLLDIIYPGYWDNQGYLKVSYPESNEAVDKWAKDNNYAVYEDWRENFSVSTGIAIAERNNNVGVVVDDLS